MKKLKDDLVTLIAADAGLDRVLNLVLDTAASKRQMLNEALLLKARYNEIQSLERKFGIHESEARNVLTANVLDLADEIDGAPPTSDFATRQQIHETIAPMPVAASEHVIKMNKVTKNLTSGGSAFLVHETSLSLRDGEILSIFGPNGSGKSTLMRMMGGELKPDTGSIEYPRISDRADDWIRIKKRIAYVDQFPQPWERPLLEVLRYTAAVSGFVGVSNELQVKYVLERLGLTGHTSKGWTQLSGGYRARFSLARSLLIRPRLMLLDEPLAHLDIVSQMSFLRDVRELATADHFAVAMTSQHVYEAELASDKILVLDDGRTLFMGQIQDLGSSDASIIEFVCLASTASVSQALGESAVTSPLPNLYIIKLRGDVSCNDVVDRLGNAAIRVAYCRDLSRSSRRFLGVPT